MAAAGGHWVKASSGPYSGKSVFIPAQHAIIFTPKGGFDYHAVKQGSLMIIQHPTGKWEVVSEDSKHPGEYYSHGVYASKQLAKGKMGNMHEAGYVKAKNAGDTAAAASAAKVGAVSKKKTPVEGETAPKNAGAATVAQAKPQAQSGTKEWFEANQKEVPIITKAGYNQKAQGAEVEGTNGKYSITYNKNTGQYHLNKDGKTVEISGNPKLLYKSAKNSYKNDAAKDAEAAAKLSKLTPEIAAINGGPSFPGKMTIKDGGYALDMNDGYASASFSKDDAATAVAFAKAHNALVHGQTYQNATSAELDVLSNYQDGAYHGINGTLWGNKSGYSDAKYNIEKLDSLMAKTTLPAKMTLYRSKGSDTPLYKWASKAKVGDTYKPKGFDSASIKNIGWEGGAVTLRYNAPKGVRGCYINAVKWSGKGSSYHYQEWEVLLGRSQSWNVTNITKNGNQITVDLDFVG